MSEWILSTDNLSRSFGGLAAVDQVSFQVKKHEVFGIVGPNGAGKSTLFNLIAGVLPPSHGKIEAFGHRIDRMPTQKRCWLGIGRTFQAAQMFPTHTIGESLLSAGSAKHRGMAGWMRPVDLKSDRQEMLEFLEFIGLKDMQGLLPSELTNLQQQKLAIGMALITDPQLLLLDEPSGGLIEAEVLELLAFIRSIRERGITIVVIDHKMRLMMNLSDRIMVMSAGKMIALDVPKKIASDVNVQNAYLGRPVGADK
jgi:branched-chain amino acid transport system ATP-binding protein